MARARGISIALTFTRRGGLTPSQTLKIEALATDRVKILTLDISNGKIIGSVISALEAANIPTSKIGYLVLGADMDDIMNKEDTLGYNDWRKSAPDERLKTNFQVLGVQQATQGDLYSGPDFAYAALSVISEAFGLPSRYLKGLRQIVTPWGFPVWVLGPIVDKEVREALLANKQVESAA